MKKSITYIFIGFLLTIESVIFPLWNEQSIRDELNYSGPRLPVEGDLSVHADAFRYYDLHCLEAYKRQCCLFDNMIHGAIYVFCNELIAKIDQNSSAETVINVLHELYNLGHASIDIESYKRSGGVLPLPVTTTLNDVQFTPYFFDVIYRGKKDRFTEWPFCPFTPILRFVWQLGGRISLNFLAHFVPGLVVLHNEPENTQLAEVMLLLNRFFSVTLPEFMERLTAQDVSKELPEILNRLPGQDLCTFCREFLPGALERLTSKSSMNILMQFLVDASLKQFRECVVGDNCFVFYPEKPKRPREACATGAAVQGC